MVLTQYTVGGHCRPTGQPRFLGPSLCTTSVCVLGFSHRGDAVGFLRKLILFALVAEMSWAAYEWWAQVNALMTYFSAPAAIVEVVSPARPVMAAVGSLGMRANTGPPSRRTENSPIRETSSLPAVMDFPTDAPTLAPIAGDDVSETAKRYLEEHRETWGLRPYHEFRPRVSTNPNGTNVIFSVFQDGLEVEGLTIDLSFSSEKSVASVVNLYRPVGRADVTGSSLSPSEVLANNEHYAANGSVDGARRVLDLAGNGATPELSYWIPVREKNTGRVTQGLFRASDGQFLREQLSFSN